jgi:hypothetical protein
VPRQEPESPSTRSENGHYVIYALNFQDYAAMNGVYVTYFKLGRAPGTHLRRRHGPGARRARRDRSHRQAVAAPGRHSTIASARDKTEVGRVSPSDFAVLRLMTSSSRVGCSMGRSPAFAPLMIRST